MKVPFLELKPGYDELRGEFDAAYHRVMDSGSFVLGKEVPKWAEPVWHFFAVRHRRRDEFQDSLAEAGIGTQIHYPVPPHLPGADTQASWKSGDFPVAEEIANMESSLPLDPHFEPETQEMAIQAIRRNCGQS
jgi:dTDP-4-amino-4,6-dideoxygalactose transaminase